MNANTKQINQWGKTLKSMEKDIKKLIKQYGKEDAAGRTELAPQFEEFQAELSALKEEVCSVPGVKTK